MSTPDNSHLLHTSVIPETVRAPELGELAGSPPSFVGYLPELWTVRKDDIYAAQSALRDGIEYTRELLIKHDSDLGRTHRSNRIAAEHMEKAIAAMQCALLGLRPAPIGDLENT